MSEEPIDFPVPENGVLPDDVSAEDLRGLMTKTYFEVITPMLQTLSVRATEENGNRLMNEIQTAANFLQTGLMWFQAASFTVSATEEKGA